MHECPTKRRLVYALQAPHKRALVLVETLQTRQQVVGHHRRQRDGDDEARQDRDDVGLTERREQAALDAG